MANVFVQNFFDVNSLSDEQCDEPAPKAGTERKKPGRKPAQPTEKKETAGENSKPIVKKPATKAKGKPKAKAKAKGKAGRPKKSENTKTVARKKKTEEEETEEKETPDKNVDPTDNEEENTSKAGKKSVLKRPAASPCTVSGSSPPMKRPSAANAPLRVWKYQYGSGVYGFKDSRVNKEVLRVAVANFVLDLICYFIC